MNKTPRIDRDQGIPDAFAAKVAEHLRGDSRPLVEPESPLPSQVVRDDAAARAERLGSRITQHFTDMRRFHQPR